MSTTTTTAPAAPTTHEEAAPAGLRVYNETTDDRVMKHYKEMHANQTLEYSRKMRAQFGRQHEGIVHAKMPIIDAADGFEFFDESDPDFESNNKYHIYQTAEACRKAFPDQDWLHLTGFLHDLGKGPLTKFGVAGWSIGGDTYPLGCKVDPCIVLSKVTKFPDETAKADENGHYKPGCGFGALEMSYGHDQYMYDVLVNHPQCTLPAEGLYLVRFHSFYPWHQHQAYKQFADENDWKMLPLLKQFQKMDLYSKVDDMPKVEDLRAYYTKLIDKYCPGVVQW